MEFRSIAVGASQIPASSRPMPLPPTPAVHLCRVGWNMHIEWHFCWGTSSLRRNPIPSKAHWENHKKVLEQSAVFWDVAIACDITWIVYMDLRAIRCVRLFTSVFDCENYYFRFFLGGEVKLRFFSPVCYSWFVFYHSKRYIHAIFIIHKTVQTCLSQCSSFIDWFDHVAFSTRFSSL